MSPGIRWLEKAYDVLERDGRVGPHRAYEMLLDVLGHGLHLTVLPQEKYPPELHQEVSPLLIEWSKAWVKHSTLEDDLGAIMEHRAFATFDSAGQFLTPMNVSRMMAKMNLGNEEENFARFEAEGRPLRVLDPAVGTGRMLLAVAEHTADWQVPFQYCGVDVDVRMVRATLVNLMMANLWRLRHGKPVGVLPRVLHADALRVEIRHPDAWRAANRWVQPSWTTLPALGSGAPVKRTGLLAFTGEGEVRAPVRTVEEASREGISAARARAPKGAAAPARGRQVTFGGGAVPAVPDDEAGTSEGGGAQ